MLPVESLRPWQNIFAMTGPDISALASESWLPVAEVLKDFPAALLTPPRIRLNSAEKHRSVSGVPAITVELPSIIGTAIVS